MSSEPIHSLYGTPLNEWINQIPAELPVDAVGLWQFIPEARERFNLEGEDLVVCIKQVLYALLDRGAKPVRGGVGTDHDWIEQTYYGCNDDEIVNSVIGEWRGWGLGNPTAGGLWFALPELFG